jgi:YspA, cpYpsA-related SLOG family
MDASGKEGLAYHRSASYYRDMRILVTGDRHWRCDELAERILTRLLARYGADIVVVHGGAPGLDNAFAVACRKLGVVAEPQVADWKGLGNVAGPARNRDMCRGVLPRSLSDAVSSEFFSTIHVAMNRKETGGQAS